MTSKKQIWNVDERMPVMGGVCAEYLGQVHARTREEAYQVAAKVWPERDVSIGLSEDGLSRLRTESPPNTPDEIRTWLSDYARICAHGSIHITCGDCNGIRDCVQTACDRAVEAIRAAAKKGW